MATLPYGVHHRLTAIDDRDDSKSLHFTYAEPQFELPYGEDRRTKRQKEQGENGACYRYPADSP